MDLQTAIERAKSALEERVSRYRTIVIPQSLVFDNPTETTSHQLELHLDTEALQTLRETLLGMELAKQPDSSPTGEGRAE